MVGRFFVLVVALSLLVAAAPSPQAKVAFDRGEDALKANRLTDAEAAYREAIAATPGYAAAINGLGSALFKQGRKDEAIATFKDAIAADTSFQLAYFNLGYAARKNNDFTTAAAAYERYTQLNPSDPDGFYGLGESYRQSNQPQKAIAAYEQFLNREKRPSEQKWIDKAKESVSTLKAELASAQQAPPPANNPPPNNNPQPPPGQGQGQGQGQQVATAQQPPPPQGNPGPANNPMAAPQPQSMGIPQGGSPQPALAKARISEGDRMMADKRYREASFAYQDATNADPANIEALFKLGNSYAVLGYYAQAIERWTRVTQISPDPAIRKSAQDNISKAQSKMAQLGGGSPQSQGKPPGTGPVADNTRASARRAYEQGVQLINQRNYPGAIQSLSQAISLEPTLAVAYVARGSAHIGVRRYPEAAADYSYALRLDGNMASPLYGLAEAYRAMGRTSDARQYYERYVASTAQDVRPDLQQEARSKADRLR